MRLLSLIRRTNELPGMLSRQAALLGGACIVFLTLSVVYVVFMRYILQRAPGPFVDINSLIMVPVAFLGVAYCVLERGHPRVDLVVRLLPQRWQWWLELISYLIALLVAFLLAWALIDRTWDAISGGYISQTINFPIWPSVGLAAVGAFFFFLVAVQEVVRLVRARPEEAPRQTGVPKA